MVTVIARLLEMIQQRNAQQYVVDLHDPAVI